VSKKFQLVPPRFERPPRVGESYFIRSLFFAVILPEASLLGDSERRKKIRRIFYKSLLSACPLVIIGSSIGMYHGYRENADNIKQVNQYIDYYQSAISDLKQGDDSLLAILPALQQITHAYRLYVDSNYWGLKFLFMSHTIKSDIYDTLQRVLHTMFIPRIAAQLEDSLNKNIQDQNLLYATLKGYLVFNASSYTNQYSINAPIEYKWNHLFIHKPKIADKLRDYLNIALKRSVEKLPLDQNLINRTRGQLEQIIPFQRAYGLLTLRANVSNVPDLVFRSSIGNNFDKVFKVSDATLKIPALYTGQGYTRIFLSQYKSIANEVVQDNRDIGLASEAQEIETSSKLKSDLQHAYNQRYIKAWNKALASIDIKSFSNLKDAITVLNLLISQRSPMSRMLNLIYDNTHNINNNFARINNYNTSSNSVSWHHTVQVLTKLRDYFVKLQQASDQDQASFATAKDVIQKSKEDPVQQLTAIAQQAPRPLQRWLLRLADNCWQIIVQGAHNYMNSAWRDNVMSIYHQSINDRYPLNSHGYSAIAIADFNKFYGNGGILDKYFNNYIKPFVNTHGKIWQQYSVNNHTIELSQRAINIFSKAKKIRDEFFPNGAKQTGFTITMKPITLDSRLASIKLIVGPKQLIYSHGPQHISTINWPLPVTQNEARAIITDFNNKQYVASGSGPWSLFKLFKSGSFRMTRNAGTYLFYIHLRGFSATYRITGPSNIGLFRLTNLRGFKLPNKIAQT
jgi:type VI secretion system protein ImpL